MYYGVITFLLVWASVTLLTFTGTEIDYFKHRALMFASNYCFIWHGVLGDYYTVWLNFHHSLLFNLTYVI